MGVGYQIIVNGKRHHAVETKWKICSSYYKIKYINKPQTINYTRGRKHMWNREITKQMVKDKSCQPKKRTKKTPTIAATVSKHRKTKRAKVQIRSADTLVSEWGEMYVQHYVFTPVNGQLPLNFNLESKTVLLNLRMFQNSCQQREGFPSVMTLIWNCN